MMTSVKFSVAAAVLVATVSAVKMDISQSDEVWMTTFNIAGNLDKFSQSASEIVKSSGDKPIKIFAIQDAISKEDQECDKRSRFREKDKDASMANKVAFEPDVQQADSQVLALMGAPFGTYAVSDILGFAKEDKRLSDTQCKRGEETFRYKYWALLAEKLYKKIEGSFWAVRWRDPVYSDANLNPDQQTKRMQVIHAYKALNKDKRHKGLFGGKKDGVNKNVMKNRRGLLDNWYQAWFNFANSLSTQETLHSWKLFETAVAEVRAVRQRDIDAALAKLDKQLKHKNTTETSSEVSVDGFNLEGWMSDDSLARSNVVSTNDVLHKELNKYETNRGSVHDFELLACKKQRGLHLVVFVRSDVFKDVKAKVLGSYKNAAVAINLTYKGTPALVVNVDLRSSSDDAPKDMLNNIRDFYVNHYNLWKGDYYWKNVLLLGDFNADLTSMYQEDPDVKYKMKKLPSEHKWKFCAWMRKTYDPIVKWALENHFTEHEVTFDTTAVVDGNAAWPDLVFLQNDQETSNQGKFDITRYQPIQLTDTIKDPKAHTPVEAVVTWPCCE
jgi:hypothetical protein